MNKQEQSNYSKAIDISKFIKNAMDADCYDDEFKDFIQLRYKREDKESVALYLDVNHGHGAHKVDTPDI